MVPVAIEHEWYIVSRAEVVIETEACKLGFWSFENANHDQYS